MEELDRREHRYIVLPDQKQRLLDKISPFFSIKRYSERENVHTIYFDTDDNELPLTQSVRIRSYLSQLPGSPLTDGHRINEWTANYGEGEYYIDFKETKLDRKHKIRKRARTFDQAINIVRERSELPLRPIIIVYYHRNHYTNPDNEDIRMTIDDNIEYFWIEQNGSCSDLGREDEYSRFEVKIKDGDSGLQKELESIVSELELIPSISKRFTGHGLFRRLKTKHLSQDNNQEIKALLYTDSEKTFHDTKNYFRATRDSELILPSTFESACIETYSNDSKKRINGRNVESIKVANKRIMPNSEKLNCIIGTELIQVLSSSDSFSYDNYTVHMEKGFFARFNRQDYLVSLHRYRHALNVHEVSISAIGNKGDETQKVEGLAQLTKVLLGEFPRLNTLSLI